MKQTVLAILVGACAGLLAFVAAVNNSRQKQAAPRVPRPDASPSLDFQYFPGEPKGYAGYTDHISMQQTVNDDLVEHDADWQFSRIGFAKGFLRTVLRRADRSPSAPGIFRMEGVSEDDAMTIEWIARMQTDGIDNASPSTSNLKSIVDGMASDIASTGPRRSTFGSRAGVDGREGMERDEISSERLRELTKLMRDAERRRVAGGPCPDRAAGIERSRDGRRRSVGWRTFRCRSSVPPGVSDIAFQGPDCRARP
ncbi:TPA: hypothetical protein ACT5CR_007353 [Burkholderia cenocepacia]|jgi:hypothetical protein|uniref:hypothetical protein n=1 Tax=Burkholderia TaxID=32008 RepID=UPI000AB40C30|nr:MULTISPECIES: hypothetical protein [Burkholderia]MCW5147865.1 hypothetical protein [Burkholderia cenocepacia]MCW5183336.1 hypothetical protein [Burkholderia cenocepacia]MDA3672351.1 hypothetical protein [Burkholderia cenocepacia]MDA3675851.1 hypothetical protein [Burkholderia cenocepacia]MDA3684152.1 hypothetical protein [Burkholderia cenocepacia]